MNTFRDDNHSIVLFSKNLLNIRNNTILWIFRIIQENINLVIKEREGNVLRGSNRDRHRGRTWLQKLFIDTLCSSQYQQWNQHHDPSTWRDRCHWGHKKLRPERTELHGDSPGQRYQNRRSGRPWQYRYQWSWEHQLQRCSGSTNRKGKGRNTRFSSSSKRTVAPLWVPSPPIT